METKWLIKYFTLLLIIIVLSSCTESKRPKTDLASNKIDLSLGNKTNMILTVSNDSILIFTDTVNFNGIEYAMRSIQYDTSNYKLIQLIKKEDTIEFYQDALVSASIFDINNDKKKDLNVTYQTTKGFVLHTYLFDNKNNALNIRPMELYNYTQISNGFFFQINKDFCDWEFNKYRWTNNDKTYMYSVLIDVCKEKPTYFKVSKNDTILLNGNYKTDRAAIDHFLLNIGLKKE